MKPRLETAGKLRPTLLRLAIFAAAVLAPAAASAATATATETATATATAYVSVVVPRHLSVGMTSGMNFGAVVPNGGPGEVKLSPTGELRGTNVDLIGGGTDTPASFALSGGPNQAYSISLPENVTLATGIASLEMTAFTHDAGPSPTMDGTGSHGFNVGATLLVNGSHSGGADSGDSGAPNPHINVMVSYN